MFIQYIPEDIVVQGVLFVHCNPLQKGHYPLKIRANHGFIYVLSGNAVYQTTQGTFEVGAHDIFYLSKNEQYEFDVINDDYDVIYINFELSPEGEGAFASGVAMHHAKSKGLALFQRLNSLYQRKNTSYLLECRITLYHIFQLLLQEQQKKYMPSHRMEPVHRALMCMEERYSDPTLTVGDLAGAAGISEGHLRRLFQQLYRVSPAQYLLTLRMSHAKDLLQTGTLPVAEIAIRTGFSSAYYFSDAFRRNVGESPTAWRKSHDAD